MVGVGVLIRDEDQFLIIKRAVDPDAGFWSIPGGLVEIGERAAEAAVREAKEETSLDVEIIDILDIVDRIIRDDKGRIKFQFVIVDFLARPRSGSVKASSDALEARWIRPEEFPSYKLTPTLIDLLKRMDIYPEPKNLTETGGR